MPKRMQSPSSINTYKQCPRRYFYQYIMRVKTRPNIHCIRGNVVHSALEKFFDLEPTALDNKQLKSELASYLKNLFEAYWAKSRHSLNKLGMEPEQLHFYYEDSIHQLANWLNQFFIELDSHIQKSDFPTAFAKMKPFARELEFKSQDLQVRGFIDYIEKDDDKIIVMDYKTSKKFDITPQYKLQLGIYAVLYEEKYGTAPNQVGIWFLKDRAKIIDVDEEMLKNAKFEIEQIHFSTEPADIGSYKQKPSPLCKYSTGQCDFYDMCKPKRGY